MPKPITCKNCSDLPSRADFADIAQCGSQHPNAVLCFLMHQRWRCETIMRFKVSHASLRREMIQHPSLRRAYPSLCIPPDPRRIARRVLLLVHFRASVTTCPMFGRYGVLSRWSCVSGSWFKIRLVSDGGVKTYYLMFRELDYSFVFHLCTSRISLNFHNFS
jgi:hypothetical protein